MNRIDHDLLSQLRAHSSPSGQYLLVDAGVSHLRLRTLADNGCILDDRLLPSNQDLRTSFEDYQLEQRLGADFCSRVFITGKLAPMVHAALGGGRIFLHAGALWLAAAQQVRTRNMDALAMIEISASGYMLVAVDGQGRLRDDVLIQNPRCGAGSGVNIDRVLQKLGLDRSEVDVVLANYLGEAGRSARARITTRADRCGVFGASATISDKNQGIPLAVALATTLKSEVQKVCRKLPQTAASYGHVIFLGRFFSWQFVRDCAQDALEDIGVRSFSTDTAGDCVLDALQDLIERVGTQDLAQPDWRLLREQAIPTYPAFSALKDRYEYERLYTREPCADLHVPPVSDLSERPVHIGLDVGSTMAKIVMCDDNGTIVFLDACSNAGDTIQTVKRIFSDLLSQGFSGLRLRSIGITGSARYQVREALIRLYPDCAPRVAVLVENYAHARGSIDQARSHIARLKEAGVADINEDFCILVDIGGEDTKISTLALQEAELFANAMNVKCSAGTGSLMDTLAALFGVEGAGQAGLSAMRAHQGHAINATCAVFLMENAQKLQAQGVPREEIFASANWAIVENMARTLWSQIDLPPKTVVLLHGQTMLSDPLPLAVTHRLQTFLGEPAYCLTPPYPGHRACLGLIRSLSRSAVDGTSTMHFSTLLDSQFEKRIIQCKGAACEDDEAICNRTSLKCKGTDGKHFTFTLGGCSAINELFARARERKDQRTIPLVAAAPQELSPVQVRDSYKEIWDAVSATNPQSDDPDRLVIPRSFVVSEWAGFLAQIFVHLGIPVHVDNVIESDLPAAQPAFDIDSCAPHMGAVGQFRRLAGAPHGVILAAQIEKLPTGGQSIGRTCTLNQGGIAVAANLAQLAHPSARVHLVNLDLETLDAQAIADQLHDQLRPIFDHYHCHPSRNDLVRALDCAQAHRLKVRADIADLAADLIEEALDSGFKIALVVGREYLLNPGIYDSHVRRLLRDKAMAAIPSYVLDIALDPQFGHIYWRNPHVINTILAATAQKCLHQRIEQPRLAALFARIEASDELLPIVQVSTFCCGPDSVTLPLSAQLMKQRPFLLIQSDAIIKELAHLENRVNTYVRQLDSGLHSKLSPAQEAPFDVRTLDRIENQDQLSKENDVIYFPTLADNRVLTSVLRGAGFTCIDNYDECADLQTLIKSGRKSVGDTVCAPMAGVYADLARAQEDFAQRLASKDPLVEGKKRLLYFDNAGTGPCRQGQYVEMHKLALHRDLARTAPEKEGCSGSMEGALRFLVAREAQGYNFGLEEWTLLRLYQGCILQGVLHDLLFVGGAACADYAQYQHFIGDYRRLKDDIYKRLEAFDGPGWVGRAAIALLGTPAKLFAYRLQGDDITPLLRRFARQWCRRPLPDHALNIHVSGEVYMRVAQAEEIFRTLLAQLGFGRFHLAVAPVWGYLEYLVEESAQEAQEAMRRTRAAIARERETNTPTDPARATHLHDAHAQWERVKRLRWMLRTVMAKPLYEAAGLALPPAAVRTMETAKELLPTLRPIGELGPYIGEVLAGLREGTDLFINVAPSGCMVSAMGQVITPRIKQAAGGMGHIQALFSGDGEVNDELLSMAVLKTLGPERFFCKTPTHASV